MSKENNYQLLSKIIIADKNTICEHCKIHMIPKELTDLLKVYPHFTEKLNTSSERLNTSLEKAVLELLNKLEDIQEDPSDMLSLANNFWKHFKQNKKNDESDHLPDEVLKNENKTRGDMLFMYCGFLATCFVAKKEIFKTYDNFNSLLEKMSAYFNSEKVKKDWETEDTFSESLFSELDNKEKECLVEFANAMHVLCDCFKNNKLKLERFVDAITLLCENGENRYTQGSGKSIKTKRRNFIYYMESKTIPRSQKRKAPSNDSDDKSISKKHQATNSSNDSVYSCDSHEMVNQNANNSAQNDQEAPISADSTDRFDTSETSCNTNTSTNAPTLFLTFTFIGTFNYYNGSSNISELFTGTYNNGDYTVALVWSFGFDIDDDTFDILLNLNEDMKV